VKSFNNAKKEMPKHFLTYDLSKTTAIDKEPRKSTRHFGSIIFGVVTQTE